MRSLLQSAVLMGFVALGIGGTAQAEHRAGDLSGVQNNAAHDHYHVYYRSCSHDSWSLYGSYEDLCDAQAAARYLGRLGYQVRVD